MTHCFFSNEVTRENWLKYNNPDGPQQTEMGIALPPWIIEAQNNIWVLGVYGLIFGGALPALVGRWWFGSRAQTKDGVDASTAAAFFRVLKEESDMPEVVGAIGQAAEWDLHKALQQNQQIDSLEHQVAQKLGDKWTELCQFAGALGQTHTARRRALALLYAHLLRLNVEDSVLQKGKRLSMNLMTPQNSYSHTEQTQVILQTPTLLNALLSITLARSWLGPTLTAMRLHAYLAQALVPRNSSKKGLEIGQLPRVDATESTTDVKTMSEFATKLESSGDARASEVNKVLAKWPRLELVSADFKGEWHVCLFKL
jgi:translocation protein SEC63